MNFNQNILIILLFLLIILCLNKEGMEVEGDSGLLETLKGYFEGLFETLFPGDKKVDVARAVAELDHEPQMVLEEGIAQTVAWMRQVYCAGEDRQTCRNRDESVI